MRWIIIKNKKSFFLIAFTTILIFSTQISYARYITTEILNGVQEIATPVIQIKEGNIAQIDRNNNIGYYEFCVKNFEQEKISEIDFLYTIEIISDLEDKVKFELYSNEQQISMQDLKTNEISLGKNKKIEQSYKLKITYNPTVEVSEECMKHIQIKIHSVQEKI